MASYNAELNDKDTVVDMGTMDLSKAEYALDDVLIEQIQQLQASQDLLSKFEHALQQKDDDFCEQTILESNEYNLWRSMLESDICHYESEMQSYRASLQDIKLDFEARAVQKSLQTQKTFVFETEVNKLRDKYEHLQTKIKQESLTHIEEYDVLIGTSRNYGQQIIFAGNIFSVVLSFIDIEDIFVLERVCISWYDAIHSWKGWMINSHHEDTKQNNLQCLNRYRELVETALGGNSSSVNGSTSVANLFSDASSNYSNDEKMFFQRFRRFVLSIETQKNSMYQVEIVGYSDKNMNAANTLVHDKSKKRVTIQAVEGDKKLEKEFSICDVILGNHQRLARIKEKCERLKSRCESDKNTQRGYQLTTAELQREVDVFDKRVKELDLQQNSDLNTIKFLKQEIEHKQQRLSELKQVPQELKQTEEENHRMFQQKMNDLENAADNDLQEVICKTQKERDTLSTAIKMEQANLRSITQKRDELKQKYDYLKDQITKLTNTGDLL